MKVKHALFLLLLFASTANANQSQEDVDADFLEFLAEMEEVTGDGFENWLEDENEDEIMTENTKSDKDE